MSYSSVLKIKEQIAEFEYLKSKILEKPSNDANNKILIDINSAIFDLNEEVKYLMGLPNREIND